MDHLGRWVSDPLAIKLITVGAGLLFLGVAVHLLRSSLSRYVVDYKNRRSTRDRLFTRILEEIDKVPDKVGIAASTLNIEKLAPLEIRIPDPVRMSRE